MTSCWSVQKEVKCGERQQGRITVNRRLRNRYNAEIMNTRLIKETIDWPRASNIGEFRERNSLLFSFWVYKKTKISRSKGRPTGSVKQMLTNVLSNIRYYLWCLAKRQVQRETTIELLYKEKEKISSSTKDWSQRSPRISFRSWPELKITGPNLLKLRSQILTN